MTKEEEEVRIAAAVQKQLQTVMLEQQKQYTAIMEKTMKASLKGVDKANAALVKERDAVLKELDAAQQLRAIAEREGDKMAQKFFADKQKQFTEAAKTELLRDLTRMHLEGGKSARDIAVWLDVPLKFVENIRVLLVRLTQYAGENPAKLKLEGNPKLRFSDQGRGGTIYYESPDANFDMWWEFGGGSALVIVDIPTKEQWEARTKLPLEQRVKVLKFIGEQIVEDKVSGAGSFIIGDNVLTFYV